MALDSLQMHSIGPMFLTFLPITTPTSCCRGFGIGFGSGLSACGGGLGFGISYGLGDVTAFC